VGGEVLEGYAAADQDWDSGWGGGIEGEGEGEGEGGGVGGFVFALVLLLLLLLFLLLEPLCALALVAAAPVRLLQRSTPSLKIRASGSRVGLVAGTIARLGGSGKSCRRRSWRDD